jgi:cobalamin biosynthesis protein CobD/CbiB
MQLNFVRSSNIPDILSRRDRASASREHPVIATINQIAERIAEGIMAGAPLFWLALLLAFVAETLGIIPNG